MISYSNLFVKANNGKWIRLSLNEHELIRPFMLIDTPEAKRFAGFILMNKDIDLVLEAIDQMANYENSLIIQQSLMFFAVVTYAKCFTTNDGSRPSLDVNYIFKESDQVLKEEHDRIINLRNSYVAHAGNEFDHCTVVGTIVASGNTAIGIDINCQLAHAVNMPFKLDDFKNLCLHLKKEIKLKCDKVFGKVMENTSNLEAVEIQKQLFDFDSNEVYKMVESDEASPAGSKRYDFIKTKLKNYGV